MYLQNVRPFRRERERKRLSWDQKWKLKCYRRWQHNFSVTQQSFRQQNLSCFSSGPLQWKKNQLKSLAHRYWLQFLYKSTENRMEWETFRLLDNGNSWQTHFVARTSPPVFKERLKKSVRGKYEKRQHFANRWYILHGSFTDRLDCLWFFPCFGMQIN